MLDKKENRRKKRSEVKALGLLALFHGNTQIKSVRPSRPNVIGTEGIEWPKGDEEKNASIIITIACHHNMRLAGFYCSLSAKNSKFSFQTISSAYDDNVEDDFIEENLILLLIIFMIVKNPASSS